MLMVLLAIIGIVLVLTEIVMVPVGLDWLPSILLKPLNPNGICPKTQYSTENLFFSC